MAFGGCATAARRLRRWRCVRVTSDGSKKVRDFVSTRTSSRCLASCPISCFGRTSMFLSSENLFTNRSERIVYCLAGFFLPLPLFAFVYCLAAIYVFREIGEYEAALVTHCHVANFALSVSEAISNPDSSRYIWQAAIVLHTPSRIYFTKQLSKFYTDLHMQNSNSKTIQFWIGWIYVTGLISHLEWISLLGLTFMTSHSVFSLHEAFVAIFLVSFVIHMGMACNVERTCTASKIVDTSDVPLTARIAAPVTARRILAFLSFSSVILIAYFYQRHNRFCEAYMYSMFCLSEYVSIVLNMIFHLCGPYMIWKFYQQQQHPDVNDNWSFKKTLLHV